MKVSVDLGWLAMVPKIKKPRVPLFARDLRYLRTDDEIRRFFDAAFGEGEVVGTLYATAV